MVSLWTVCFWPVKVSVCHCNLAKAECIFGSLLTLDSGPSMCKSCVTFVFHVDEPNRLVSLRLSALSKWKQWSCSLFLQFDSFFFFLKIWDKLRKTKREKRCSGGERPVSYCPFNLATSLFAPTVALLSPTAGTVLVPPTYIYLLGKGVGGRWTYSSSRVLYFPSPQCSVMCFCPARIHGAFFPYPLPLSVLLSM